MATVQSDPYSIFIRKIGYSVGLENSLNRIRDLVSFYVKEREISVRSWEMLVHSPNHWGLKGEHIADFFKSIEILRRLRGEIQILSNLDALALVKRELQEAEHFEIALRFIFASAITIADGDIFLNFLAGEFDRARVERLLRAMIIRKRRVLREAIRIPALLERVFELVSIDVQPTNVGGAAARRSLSERVRREPLKPRKEPLSQVLDESVVEVSDDYFRKVTGRRKDWARSTGLCSEQGRISDRGASFLRAFEEMGLRGDSGDFAYWPFEFELERLALRPESLGIPRVTLRDHLRAIWSGLGCGPIDETRDATTAVLELGRRFYATYQELNPRRQMLRREMPVGVILTAAAGYFATTQKALPPVQEILWDEAHRPGGIVTYRLSRNFEGTIAFKS